MAKKGKFYVVWKGKKPGIFDSWKECKKSIANYAGAEYKSFESFETAKKAYNGNYADFKGKKKTVGIRVPNNNIIHDIILELGNPILSTSIHDEDEILEYTTDPELINEKFHDIADIIIDGGYGELVPSTIVDCSKDEIEILREGKGILEY